MSSSTTLHKSSTPDVTFSKHDSSFIARIYKHLSTCDQCRKHIEDSFDDIDKKK